MSSDHWMNHMLKSRIRPGGRTCEGADGNAISLPPRGGWLPFSVGAAQGGYLDKTVVGIPLLPA